MNLQNRIKYVFKSVCSAIYDAIKMAIRAIGIVLSFIGRTTLQILYFLFTPYDGFNAKNGAAFMTKWKQRKFLSSSNKGFVLDGKSARLSLNDSYSNVFVSGVTGSGKSAGILLPSLFLLETSAVILDVSGELFRKTGRYLKKRKGFKVINIDLNNLSETPVRFNPLARALKDENKLRRLMLLITQSGYGSKQSSDSFWTLGAINIMMIVAKALKSQKEEYQTLANLKHILGNINGDESLGHKWLLFNADNQTHNEYVAWRTEPKTEQSFLATAVNALEFINNPLQRNFTAYDNLDFTALRKEKVVLFLSCREMHLSSLRTLLSIFFTELFEYLMEFKETHNPVSLYIDEASTLDLDYSKYLSLTRKYKIACMLVYQSYSQVIEQLGTHNAATLINGATKTRVWLPGVTDINELRLIEALLGKAVVSENGYDKRQSLLAIDEITKSCQ